jgi:integrase
MGALSTVRAKIPRGVRSRNGVLYIGTHFMGVRIAERVGPMGPGIFQQAKELLFKRKNEVRQAKLFPEKAQCSLTARELLNQYWDRYLKYKPYSKTAKFLLSRIDGAFGGRVALELTLDDLDSYARKRLEDRKIIYLKDGKTKCGQPIKPRTVNAEVEQLQMAFSRAVRNRVLPYNPVSAWDKLNEGPPSKRHLSSDEWLRLHNACGEKIKDIVELQYETGMRISEVLGLRRSWVDMIGNWIHLPPESTKTGRRTGVGRDVPLSARAKEIILNRPAQGEFVFPNPATGLPYKGIFKPFRTAAAKAGLGRITTHVLRKTRENVWAQLDEQAAADSCGNTIKVARRHYTSVANERKQALVKVA